MSRVAVHTLGCKLNFAETATIARQFTDRGFTVVGLDDSADVVVLNTCSVTERADRECRQLVRRALRHSPDAYVVILGCYAQLQPATLAAIPGVDLVLGTKEKFDVFQHADWVKKERARTAVTPIKEVDTFHNAMSFCTIPLARGRSRSVSPPVLLNDAACLVGQGYKEIVLTGVNVGDYGKHLGSSLLALLQQLETIDGLERIRVSSIEPNLLSDELIDFWLGSAKLCKHFHIPLQSGSDPILRGMRRRYRREWYADRLDRIKSLFPKAGIGSDVIVGFPGETYTFFQETYRFLVDQPVSYLHVFTFSERPNTPANDFMDKVEPGMRAQRSEQLRILSARKRRAFSEGFVGSIVDVLFESGADDGLETGLSNEYLRVSVSSPNRLENNILPVKIEDVSDDGCFGTVCSSFASSKKKEATVPW
ncbi:MAG: MiaB/RimO family radical SAM methylthiotransferase [Ignavibacteriales bacterium]|nr:MiaB/RimO family radical SAM methylthiotransferase [Ignavibacteriales bacterium]